MVSSGTRKIAKPKASEMGSAITAQALAPVQFDILDKTNLSTRIAVIAVPTVLTLSLCLYGIGSKPLWLDEVTTYHRAGLPFIDLVVSSLQNKHLPVYFLLERYFNAASVDEALLRFPSAICVALTTLFLALAALEVSTPKGALLTGLLAAVAPAEIQFGQEARPYALASCLIAVALWGLLRITRLADAPGFARRTSVAAWATYGVASALAVNVLLVSWAWVAVSNVVLFVLSRQIRPSKFNRLWLATQGSILAISMPGLFGIYLFSGHDAFAGYRWIPASTFQHVSTILSSTYLFRFSDLSDFSLIAVPWPWVGWVVAGAAIWGAIVVAEYPTRMWAIALAATAMPIFVLIISIWHPLWVPRYLLWSVGPYLILAGVGLARLPKAVSAAFIIVITVGAGMNAMTYYAEQTKPRWDAVATYLGRNVGPKDLIVVNSDAARDVLSVYAAKSNLDLSKIVTAGKFSHSGNDIGAERIWAVYGRTGYSRLPTEARYLRVLGLAGIPCVRMSFGTDIRALRFDLMDSQCVQG
jgi:hypothetical protein